jgi:Ca2+-binding RTX toxin-like protein
LLRGGRGDDRLTGGAGDDRFRGGAGEDTPSDLTPAEGQNGSIR